MSLAAFPIPRQPGEHRAVCGKCAQERHRPRDDALAVRVEADGAVLWYCHRCGWSGRTKPDGSAPFDRAGSGDAARLAEERRQAEREARAAALWRAARPIAPDDPADRYLAGRGLSAGPDGWPATLRLGRHEGSAGHAWPCLVAAATRWPGRDPVAAQATPLARRDGRVVKAWTKPARLTFGVLRAAAVRLAPWLPGRPVVLVEGVEDGLAILAADPDAVPWAVLGARNAVNVILPQGVDVILALDGDDAGRTAARQATAALWARGHRVRIAELPDGTDPAALAARPA